MNQFQHGAAFNEIMATDEQLSREQFQLAVWMEENRGMDFKDAVDAVFELCDEILPGYRGTAKLTMFRNHVRDRMMEAEK